MENNKQIVVVERPGPNGVESLTFQDWDQAVKQVLEDLHQYLAQFDEDARLSDLARLSTSAYGVKCRVEWSMLFSVVIERPGPTGRERVTFDSWDLAMEQVLQDLHRRLAQSDDEERISALGRMARLAYGMGASARWSELWIEFEWRDDAGSHTNRFGSAAEFAQWLTNRIQEDGKPLAGRTRIGRADSARILR
jgi:hypothetical protein